MNKFSTNIEPNARIAFIRTSGCGTSTLLDMLTSKTQPTVGEIYRHTPLKKATFLSMLWTNLIWIFYLWIL